MDAKSLLRAKKAAARIEHPYASYTAAGVLRCSICAVPVKQWDAHLLTKQHRQSAAREKEIAAKAEKEKAKAEKAKRKAGEEGGSAAKRAKVEEQDDDGPSLPAGFFSSGKPSVAEAEAEPESPPKASTGDAELDGFLASLNDDEPPQVTVDAGVVAKKRRGYKDDDEGGVASYSAAPVLLNSKEPEPEPEPEETEAERRARLEQEEREEIMARLDEEERAQEDADSRVSALKERVAAMKKKRDAMKAKQTKK